MSSPDVVVLSPHLDDAALSIGALIARLARGGRRVEVWTVNTRGPALDTIAPAQRVFGDYETRTREDRRALAALGAGIRWLEGTDRIWRSPPVDGALGYFTTPPTLDGFAQLPMLRRLVGDLLDDARITVYAPLGVGNHVDHVELAVATLQETVARGAWDRLRFYEDVYALGASLRKRHVVTAKRHWRALGSPAWASPRMGAMLRMVARAARGPGIEHYVPEVAELRWISVPEPVGEHERTKLAAIAEYRTQVDAFGGLLQVSPFIARGHEVLGGEPIWFARPPRSQSP